MKMNILLSTTTLVVSLALTPMAFAQTAKTVSGAAVAVPTKMPAVVAPAKAPAVVPPAATPAPVAAAQPAPGQPVNRFDQAMAKLPPEKAKLYRDAGTKIHDKNKPLADHLAKQKQELAAIEIATKFDKSAYIAKRADIEKTIAQMHANGADVAGSTLAQFTPDERKLIQWIYQPSATQPQQQMRRR